MAVSNQKARAVATKSEFELFRASLPKSVVTLTPAALKRDISRARNLRDKSRQQAKKQARAGKEGERTLVKAQMFDESLKRFEAQLAVVEKAAKKKAERQRVKARKARSKPKAKAVRAPGKKTVVRKKSKGTANKKPATKKPAPKKTATKKPATKKTTPKRKATPRKRPTSVAVAGAAKRAQAKRSGRTRVRTHVSARGKRSQVNRDGRR